MKSLLYIAVLALVAASCATSQNFSNTVEDDIYFVPGKKALLVQEVENMTGQDISAHSSNDQTTYPVENATSQGSSIPPASFSRNKTTASVESANTDALLNEARGLLATNDEVNKTIYQNTGYWIGGYKGNEGDLPEIQRIIDQYPEGFGYIANGEDIALNLSFSPDWNVYTDNGRYWWFPSSTNIDLYSSLLFGTYPKYIWTVVWNNPGISSWSFNSNLNLGLNIGWGSPGWNLSFGWNSPWYKPWYSGWYGGWYDPWYNPWYPGWHYPHWNHPHWNHPHWGGGHYPSRPQRPHSPVRPGIGNHIAGVRPGSSSRPGIGQSKPSTTRPNTGSSIRPGSNFQPSVTTRPRPSGVQSGNSVIRPSGTSSQTSVRPGNITRPNRPGNLRPGTTVRPGTGSSVRPGTTVRPGTITRPGTTTRPTTRPGTTTRPATTVRPGSVTRPATTVRPGARPSTSNYTRPGTSRSNVKTYSRPQSNYRPTYNNNSSTRYSTGNSSRSNFNRGSATRSSSGSSGATRTTTVRSGGGHRR